MAPRIRRHAAPYAQIAAHYRDRIRSGDLAPGDLLPSAREISAEWEVSRATADKALSALRAEGLVIGQTGIGTRVAPTRNAIPRRRVARGQLVTRDPARGYIFPAASHPGEPWQTHGTPVRAHVPVPADVAAELGVEAGIDVLRRRRVTSPEGEPPFQVVDTWIHPAIVEEAPRVADISTGPGGYLDRIEEAGHGPLSWGEVTRARMPSSEEAELLGIPVTMPVMVMTLTATSARTEAIVEVTVRVIPADRVELFAELHRDESANWPVSPVA